MFRKASAPERSENHTLRKASARHDLRIASRSEKHLPSRSEKYEPITLRKSSAPHPIDHVRNHLHILLRKASAHRVEKIICPSRSEKQSAHHVEKSATSRKEKHLQYTSCLASTNHAQSARSESIFPSR
jgi:hypothetical protein